MVGLLYNPGPAIKKPHRSPNATNFYIQWKTIKSRWIIGNMKLEIAILYGQWNISYLLVHIGTSPNIHFSVKVHLVAIVSNVDADSFAILWETQPAPCLEGTEAFVCLVGIEYFLIRGVSIYKLSYTRRELSQCSLWRISPTDSREYTRRDQQCL